MDELSYIAEGLRGLAMPVGSVHEDAANARVGHAVERIAASLRQYGQRKPIVANRGQGGRVIAGNGTLAAARVLGWSHVAVVWVDEDAASATGYSIADNRTGDLSRWDVEALGALIEALPDGTFTGFEAGELEELFGGRGGKRRDGESFEWVVGFAGRGHRFVKRLSPEERREWGYSGVWRIATVRANDRHPAMFPVELPERCVKMHSDPGDLVLEPFCGSGTTLIACENLGRRCAGVEREGRYVAVCLQRYLDAFGIRAQLEE